MTDTFDQLCLEPGLVETLCKKGYETPTPIQSAIIPVMLDGHDILGQSQTGSGKTAAYALPILQRLKPGRPHIQALIVAPTRELSIQVAEVISQYGFRSNVRCLAVYGGQPYSHQINRIKQGLDIVVGTPGRLLDLMRRKTLDFSNLSSVILDEADEMLSMGFIDDIEAILSKTPAQRQTGFFSATLPKSIHSLSQRYMQNPKTITIGRKQSTADSVEQRYYMVNESDKCAALTRLFETEQITSALIFTRTRIATSELAAELTERGFTAEALNGDMNQNARIQVLERFRSNQIKVLVATDVAARGIDIDDISHVFNYSLPQDPEIYVHRIGRTGRAGKKGIAISLICPSERWQLRKIESYIKQKLTSCTLPTEQEILLHRQNRFTDQLMVWLRRGRCNLEREMISKLLDQGHDLTEIAAVALKLARIDEKQRPIAPIGEIKLSGKKQKRIKKEYSDNKWRKKQVGQKYEKNSHEKDMVRLSLNTGKTDGVQVNHVVGSLSRHTGIPGRCFGKISIQGRHTLVDIPKDLISKVLAQTKSYRIGKRLIAVKRA
ncbi:MAG: DEAD/DEAH box helicase [Desulfobacteraceae bacterium]|nr:DEAD/DEAH box helicase [Desulfobacteraceae bacterium]